MVIIYRESTCSIFQFSIGNARRISIKTNHIDATIMFPTDVFQDGIRFQYIAETRDCKCKSGCTKVLREIKSAHAYYMHCKLLYAPQMLWYLYNV